MKFSSEKTNTADYFEAVEYCFQQKWTDGLAVVPPTESKVEELIRFSGRDLSEVIGDIPPKYGIATVEKLAINCVMAGCLPEYFPVVIAAVQAMLEPRHNLNGTQTTTHSNEPLIIVNGPLAKKLGINSGDSLFGRGFRANGTIGRAIRLILWNLGGNFPGEVDRSTFSHPGSWSYCIAEAEDESPWDPFHVEKGFDRQQSAATVFSCEAPQTIIAGGKAEQIMAAICSTMAGTGSNNFWFMGETLLVLSPLLAEQIASEGWSKADVKSYIWENARSSLEIAKRGGPQTSAETMESFQEGNKYWPSWINQNNDKEMIPLTTSPEDIHVLVAGGRYMFSAYCPGWGVFGGLAVTRKIVTP